MEPHAVQVQTDNALQNERTREPKNRVVGRSRESRMVTMSETRMAIGMHLQNEKKDERIGFFFFFFVSKTDGVSLPKEYVYTLWGDGNDLGHVQISFRLQGGAGKRNTEAIKGGTRYKIQNLSDKFLENEKKLKKIEKHKNISIRLRFVIRVE